MSKEDKDIQDWGKVNEETQKKYSSLNSIEITKENKWFYLFVVISLGLTTISAIIGSIILAYLGKEIPSALVAIGSVAVGALGGVFSRNS